LASVRGKHEAIKRKTMRKLKNSKDHASRTPGMNRDIRITEESAESGTKKTRKERQKTKIHANKS